MIEIITKNEGISKEEFFKKFGYNDKKEVLEFIKKELRYGVVYTHNGNEFHTDEVFALALLEIFRNNLNEKIGKEVYPPFKVIRGRNISKEKKGLRLDVDESILDHHFPKNEAAFRENGIQYATAGLLWAIIGSELISNKFVETIDKQVFEGIDACDNGIEGITSQYSDMIASFVPNWNENLNLESQMQKAIDFVITILERKIAEFKAIESAKLIVENAYKQSKNDKIVILPRALNWQEVLVPTNAIFVIWENDNQWSCQAVPTKVGSFELKKGFLPEWRGLRNEELQEKSHLDFIFCHSTGFYLVAKTKEAAIKACLNSL